jgi:hypothetical protein
MAGGGIPVVACAALQPAKSSKPKESPKPVKACLRSHDTPYVPNIAEEPCRRSLVQHRHRHLHDVTCQSLSNYRLELARAVLQFIVSPHSRVCPDFTVVQTHLFRLSGSICMGHQIWKFAHVLLLFTILFVLLYVGRLPKNIVEHEKHGIRRHAVHYTVHAKLVEHSTVLFPSPEP